MITLSFLVSPPKILVMQENHIHPAANNTTIMNSTEWASFVLLPVTLSGPDVLALMLLVLTCVFGLLGNSLVILVFGYRNRRKRSRFEAFLLLLAAVDLITSILIPSSFIYLTVTGMRSWHFGHFGCKLLPSLLHISITVSQGTLLLISWERYRTLVYPFEDRLKKRYIAVWMMFISLVSLFLVSPYMSTLDLVDDPTYHTRTCVPSSKKLPTLMLSASLTLLRDIVAMTMMCIVCHRMNVALSKNWSGCMYDRKAYSAKGRRMLRVVIFVFTALTLPVDIFQVTVYSIFLSPTGLQVSQHAFSSIQVVNTFLNILQASNSSVNAFIYSKMHKNFKKQMRCFSCRRYRSKDREVLMILTEYPSNDKVVDSANSHSRDDHAKSNLSPFKISSFNVAVRKRSHLLLSVSSETGDDGCFSWSRQHSKTF